MKNDLKGHFGDLSSVSLAYALELTCCSAWWAAAYWLIWWTL